VNSEHIKHRFGSYHVEVLHQDSTSRIASLYSQHDRQSICRTLAVTTFRSPMREELRVADALIREGQSIGSTLLEAGFQLQRNVLTEACAVAGEQFHALSAATVAIGTPIYVRLYHLDVLALGDTPVPYAVIAEAHHPEHVPLGAGMSRCEDLNTSTWEVEARQTLLALLAAMR